MIKHSMNTKIIATHPNEFLRDLLAHYINVLNNFWISIRTCVTYNTWTITPKMIMSASEFIRSQPEDTLSSLGSIMLSSKEVQLLTMVDSHIASMRKILEKSLLSMVDLRVLLGYTIAIAKLCRNNPREKEIWESFFTEIISFNNKGLIQQ